jgi:hypothetical protein
VGQNHTKANQAKKQARRPGWTAQRIERHAATPWNARNQACTSNTHARRAFNLANLANRGPPSVKTTPVNKGQKDPPGDLDGPPRGLNGTLRPHSTLAIRHEYRTSMPKGHSILQIWRTGGGRRSKTLGKPPKQKTPPGDLEGPSAQRRWTS